jgi:glucose/arabinose dehydrogenase
VIYRCNPDGSELEVYARGFRYTYALKVTPDGRLFTISQGLDKRGVRPIETPDALYEVNQDSWYGFPTSTPAGQRRTEYNQDNDNPIGFRCSCSISASSASRARQVLGDQPEPRPEVTCEGRGLCPALRIVVAPSYASISATEPSAQ